MTLEATVVILDNTEYARNGDHLPTRYEAQTETIQAIIIAKQQMNNENAVGIMTMGGPQVEVLTTPTNDQEAILGCLFGVKLRGDEAHFLKALQIAQLALKHRKNKHMRQRVIVFVASPITDDEKTLEKVAKQMKKNSLNVDIVNLCQTGDNVAKLQKFVETVNSGTSSNFLNAESGITSLNELLFNSPILNAFADSGNSNNAGASSSSAAAAAAASSAAGQGSASRGAMMSNPFAEFGGIDPSEDPELAEVMKLSLEEEKRRKEQETAASAARAQQSQPAAAAEQIPSNAGDSSVANVQIENTMVDEAQGLLANQSNAENINNMLEEELVDFEDLDEEELMRQALLESQQENPFQAQTAPVPAPPQSEAAKLTEEIQKEIDARETNLREVEDLLQDEEFIEDLLKSIQKDEPEDGKKKE